MEAEVATADSFQSSFQGCKLPASTGLASCRNHSAELSTVADLANESLVSNSDQPEAAILDKTRSGRMEVEHRCSEKIHRIR